MGVWSFSRNVRLHGLCLMAFAAPVALCVSQEAKLAGVRHRNLPKPAEPEPWATAPISEDADSDEEKVGEVVKWVLSSHGHHHAHPIARAWRLVREQPDDTFEWCIRRLKFLTMNGEKKHGDPGCNVVEYGSEFLQDEFSATHAFKDTSQSGCVLRDPTDRIFYIGVACEDPFKLDSIQILQMSEKKKGISVRLQQLIAGQWMDVTPAFDLGKLNKTNTVFKAATCKANVCATDKMVLSKEMIWCEAQECTEDECCTEDAEAQWQGDGHHSIRAWSQSWGAPVARGAGFDIVGLVSVLLAVGITASAYRHRQLHRPDALEAESMVLEATDSERA